MHLPAFRQALAFLALPLLAFTACSDTSDQAPVGSPNSSTSSTTVAASPSVAPPAEPTNTSQSHSTPAPTATSEATEETTELSLSSVEVTLEDASEATLNKVAGRNLPGTAGVEVNIKISNTTNTVIDAAPLSFPTLIVDGEEILGTPLNDDGEEDTYGLIEPGESQTLTVFFPSENPPEHLTITLVDPQDQNSTLTFNTHL